MISFLIQKKKKMVEGMIPKKNGAYEYPASKAAELPHSSITCIQVNPRIIQVSPRIQRVFKSTHVYNVYSSQSTYYSSQSTYTTCIQVNTRIQRVFKSKHVYNMYSSQHTYTRCIQVSPRNRNGINNVYGYINTQMYACFCDCK